MKIRTDLLRKLANHLYNPRTKQNKRGLQYFRFDRVVVRENCGTAGCALGELPYCFPKQWRVAGVEFFLIEGRPESWGPPIPSLNPILNVWPEASSPSSAAAQFFGLSYKTTLSLFYPAEQSDAGILPKDSTAWEVAAHIRKYCAKVEARRK